MEKCVTSYGLLLCQLLCPLSVQATTPPTKAQIEQYKKEGTLQQRIEAAKALNTHSFNPSLIKKFNHRHSALINGNPPTTS